jgi:hypothetical protein
MNKEPGQIAYEAWVQSCKIWRSTWGGKSEDERAAWAAVEAAVRADATRELIEALEQIVILSDDYHRAVPIARAALEKARRATPELS